MFTRTAVLCIVGWRVFWLTMTNRATTPILTGLAGLALLAGSTTSCSSSGTVDDASKRLLEVTEQSLYLGIEQAVAGNRLGDIGYAIEQFVTGHGYGMVREYGGHGVGRQMWEEPHVANHGKAGTGVVLREGMTIAIEPMVNIGGDETHQLDDGWTVITRDRTRSAHFEHTILIQNGPAEIFTKRVAVVV